jgi:hypothetical protein
MIFRIKHKYCGMETTIEGENVYDAFKKANKDFSIWEVVSVKER